MFVLLEKLAGVCVQALIDFLNSFTPMGSDMSPVFFELRDRLITFLLFVH